MQVLEEKRIANIKKYLQDIIQQQEEIVPKISNLLEVSRTAVEAINIEADIQSFIRMHKKAKPIVFVQYEPYNSGVTPYTPTPTDPSIAESLEKVKAGMPKLFRK